MTICLTYKKNSNSTNCYLFYFFYQSLSRLSYISHRWCPFLQLLERAYQERSVPCSLPLCMLAWNQWELSNFQPWLEHFRKQILRKSIHKFQNDIGWFWLTLSKFFIDKIGHDTYTNTKITKTFLIYISFSRMKDEIEKFLGSFSFGGISPRIMAFNYFEARFSAMILRTSNFILLF